MGESFEEYLIRQHISPSSFNAYTTCIAKLYSFSPALTAESFRKFQVWAFRDRKPKPLSAAGMNKYILALRHWCKWQGLEWYTEFRQYKEIERHKNALSNEEIERFLAVPKASWQREADYQKWQLFFHICIFSGLRMGEVRQLTVSQIDIGQSLIHLPGNKTKSRRSRTPSLTSNVIPLLESYMPYLEGVYLFPQKGRPDVPMSTTPYHDEFDRRIQAIQIKRECVPYDLRHTAITYWLKKLKMNIFDVKKQAGHSSSKTTEKYYEYGDQDEITQQMNDDPRVQKNITPEEKLGRLIARIYPELASDPRFSFHHSKKWVEITIKD